MSKNKERALLKLQK